jgi:hypothetical protein
MPSPQEKRLLRLFGELPDEQRQMLLELAEFLGERYRRRAVLPLDPPRPIARPAGETVIGAIKRLSASYHMLDKSKMLNETSALMAQHVMQGRQAMEVIDELEAVFERYYRQLRDSIEEPEV